MKALVKVRLVHTPPGGADRWLVVATALADGADRYASYPTRAAARRAKQNLEAFLASEARFTLANWMQDNGPREESPRCGDTSPRTDRSRRRGPYRCTLAAGHTGDHKMATHPMHPTWANTAAPPVTSIESQVYIDGGWPALAAYRRLPLRCPDCGDVVVKRYDDEPSYCDTCDREVETPVRCETPAEAQQHGQRGGR